jgi:acyl carrier protein
MALDAAIGRRCRPIRSEIGPLYREDSTMDERDIRNKIKAAIAKISDIEAEDIVDTASFKDDLALDSLVLLEISVEIEMQFGFEVHEEDLKQLQTVQDTVEFVQQALVGHA